MAAQRRFQIRRSRLLHIEARHGGGLVGDPQQHQHLGRDQPDNRSITKAEVKTYSLTLTPGTYTFLCDSHPTQMKGSFKVS